MTDEEMAEEYRKSLKQRLIDEDNFERLEMFDENVEESFLAGLKAGRPQWHDLREDPNDLPSDYRTVLDENGSKVYYDYNIKYWRYDDEDLHITTPPTAWCEIPTFEKE